ncbi:MAG TPA: cellulase family glycosylhydrolase [Solirubrobacteraceae bacterium]
MGALHLNRLCRPGAAVLVIALAIFVFVLGHAPGRADETPLSISGNHFVNGSGETLQLVGVDRTSPEYACFYGYAYSNGPIDASDAGTIAAWHANAVRIPLNEDCWLGINGQPSNADSPQPPLTQAGYQQAVEQYVSDLNADGIYAILDLHWSAPGSVPANGQRPLPDDHSEAFWESVASAFKSNPAVLFDAFNEPFSPAANGNVNYPVDWSCWKNGGCEVPDANDQETVNGAQTYHAVGLQAIVDAIRSTGARQPILLGGLSYANELKEWLTYEPADPDHQLAASFHNYEGEHCGTEECWNSTIASLAEHVPVVTGEFGEEACPVGGGDDPSDFDNRYMNWADQHGVGYLAWAWVELEQTEPCGSLFMLTATGEPAEPNGAALHDHLAALALAAGTGPGSGGGSPQGGTPGGGSTNTGSTTSATPTGVTSNTGKAVADLVPPKETLAQKLAKALRACKKQKSKHKRLECEKAASKKYKPKPNKKHLQKKNGKK